MLEFEIAGGYIKIHKKIFIQEMLSKNSPLRSLLNWRSTADFTSGHPMVGEPDTDDIITINFSNMSYVNIGESPREILGTLKAKYMEKIKGRITCIGKNLGIYATFEIDLNSDDGKINFNY